MASAGPAQAHQAVPDEENVAVDTYNEDGFRDGDSAYDSEIASYTTSLASSVTDYKFVHGRRYHAYQEGRYVFPNDEQEKDRLDLVHKVFDCHMGGKLFAAPLKNPKRVLDIGTGTGIWAMEFGDQFPQADVLGCDLSPIQPRWVPPNVHFEVDDVEQEWTYSQKFDYIHSRSMNTAIHDWPRFVKQCYDNVMPGGYVEFLDWDIAFVSPDNSLPEDSVLYTANREFIRLMGEEVGADPCPGPKIEGMVTAAGFEEVKVTKSPSPFGTWPADRRMKEIGAWNYLQVMEGLEGLVGYAFNRHKNMSKEDVGILSAKMKADLKNPRIHPMCHLYCIVGRKPGAAEDAADEPAPQAATSATETPAGDAAAQPSAVAGDAKV